MLLILIGPEKMIFFIVALKTMFFVGKVEVSMIVFTILRQILANL